MRDHGGDLGRAKRRHGDGDWIDLSTGINPRAYPVGEVPAAFWARLPDGEHVRSLEDAARGAYGAGTSASVVAVGGAQAAIQLLPRLATAGGARVLGPTYNEHAAALRAGGWDVSEVTEAGALAGADLAVVVNPNNPDGRRLAPEVLSGIAADVGLLVVDESFADSEPELSLCPRLDAGTERAVVLRSFGKFYGLAGLRLGFALSGEATGRRLRELAGPWAVSGPSIAVGTRALCDRAWQAATAERLAEDAARMDGLARDAGWALVGGTPLFRTYDAGDAAGAQERLAGAKIWTRVFPYSDGWIRLGLPGDEPAWARLEAALAGG